MVITKRKRTFKVKSRRKKTVKLTPFQRVCDDLYNRLQAGEDLDALVEVVEMSCIGVVTDTCDIAVALSAKFDCQVSTLQMNYPTQVTYRGMSAYTKEPHAPRAITTRLYASIITTTYWQCVILSYLRLCRQHGAAI